MEKLAEQIINDTKVYVERQCSGYRPYYLNYNGKKYKIDSINLYTENGVYLTTRCGWFEQVMEEVTEENINTYHIIHDVDGIILPSIVRRSKQVFNKKDFYIISKGREFTGGDLEADLYIYADGENIKTNIEIVKTVVEQIGSNEQDHTIKLIKVSGLTKEPFKMLHHTYNNSRLSVYGEMAKKFKEENTYPLNNIDEYTLSALFKKYELKLRNN